eukprot:TRINITY_DN111439_c0_g1_i1.p1 TRINITY_DN111439_c0_g1~~TRINITY_DN111439_c0_g1_i1.p1  ORF type:complete len:281 (-),score=46.15 TRINITY_DN111439_c0_g1_i1:282-1124(-)
MAPAANCTQTLLFNSLSPPSPEQAACLASGLSVAGEALEPPRFHAVDWKEGQVFQSSEDPDRCSEPWKLPEFLQKTSPLEQRAKTTVEELPLPVGVTASGSFARVVHGVLDEDACAELISCINHKGYTPALINVGRGRQRFLPFIRNGFRAIVDSPELTKWVFEVIQPHLPSESKGDKLMDLNDRCRFLCYTPGQEFARHFDGRYDRPSGGHSAVTVQIYLHDVPEQNGGATTFVIDRELRVPCQPGAGSVLLFSQDLEHEGSLLRDGLKYTMRTEAMYG